MSAEKLISIHLNSNKPKSFKKFISSIVHNSQNLENIEILVSIDKNDIKMIDVIKQINCNKKDLIRYIETDLIKTFADAWKPLNLLLEETSESVKFISCMSDDIIFKTKNWDAIILKYENTFEDNIFRIRCSKYKNEVYKDIWECGYKPDSYAFYTKKWLNILGQWNPCIGPDTFQECVSYYMRKYGEKFHRDVILNEIEFDGQGVSTNLGLKDRMGRSRIYYKAFFKLVSYKIQKLSSESAFKIVKEINGVSKKMSYIKINKGKLQLTNLSRRFNFFYHRGSPKHIINSKTKNIFFMLWCYLNFFDNIIITIINFLHKKNYLIKIIRNEKYRKQIENTINNEKLS
tara:strand:- start:8606 stop:9643 length:1038 start_codon:yes stop_codon:yes gene_type:complete